VTATQLEIQMQKVMYQAAVTNWTADKTITFNPTSHKWLALIQIALGAVWLARFGFDIETIM
jgi:hypothetical protein